MINIQIVILSFSILLLKNIDIFTVLYLAGELRFLEEKLIIHSEKFLRLTEKPKLRIFDCSKKDVQRIRNRLKKHFRINDNPINPYISTRKWSCKFHFIDQRR